MTNLPRPSAPDPRPSRASIDATLCNKRRTAVTVRLAHNLKLLAQHTAGGAPNLGEGMAMKIKDGRRYMYIAHEHGPAAFSIFDVTEPADPKMLYQKPLPH